MESTSTVSGPCSEFMQASMNPGPAGYSFQRSPTCTSYLDWYKESVCEAGPGPSIDAVLPPGVWNEHLWNSYACCGGCNILDPPHVSILYWPPDTTSECGVSGTSPTSVESPPSSISLGPDIAKASGKPRTAVVDGMTL